MQFNAKFRPLVASAMLLAATQSHAALVSYTANGKDVVYSSVSDVTWTKDANLLGSMIASQGFSTVVSNILAVSPTISNTPNGFSSTGTYTLSSNDFSATNLGRTTWFGALAFVSYLNSTKYAGSNQWHLPSVINTSFGHNTATNGTTAGDELVELYYSELGGGAGINIPDTNTFDNEQFYHNWSGTEYAPITRNAWSFTFDGFQGHSAKSALFYVWAVSPAQIATVPEPENVALLLAGLGLVGGVVRCRRG